MQDHPTHAELLEAVQRFLDEEVVPHTEGRRSFLARVAANVIRIVGREIALEEEHLDREWRSLDDLLGDEIRPGTRAGLRAEIHARTLALCERIRDGEADAGAWRAKLLAHARRTVRDKLAVADPGLLARSDPKV